MHYHFDDLARLGEAQLLAAKPTSTAVEVLKPARFLSPGPLWWAFDWKSAETQAEAFHERLTRDWTQPTVPDGWSPLDAEKACGPVVLIDEIDNMNVIQLLTDVAKGTIILQIFFLFVTIYSRIFYLRCPLLYLLPFHYPYPRLQKFIHLKTKSLDPFAFFGVIYLGHLSISLENIYVGYFISSNTFSFVSQVKGQ